MKTRLPFFVLAAVVLVQAAGLVLTTLRDGTSVGTWLFLDLRWPEAASILFERVAAGVVVAASIAAALVRAPRARLVAAGVISAWFFALAIAEWHNGGAPFTDWALPAHATRIVAPLLLATWGNVSATKWILRGSIAITFFVHGLEALNLHPGFVDFLLIADQRMLGLGLDQTAAELLLRLIGTMDVALALVVLSGRDLRPVLLWMGFWGFVTAFSRIVQGGQGALHHTLIRAANGGLPVVLLLLSQRTSMDPQSSHRVGSRFARVALPIVLLMLPFAANAQSLTNSGPAHLRLVWTEDPAHQTTFSWSTQSSGSTHEVYLDTQPRNGVLSSYARKVAANRNGGYGGGSPYYHHATATGLQPDTKYYFVVVSDGVASPERYFITAHTDDRPFRLLFGGDSRSGVSDRQKMNDLMADLVEQDPGIIALAHGGDYIDSAGNWSEWNSWLEDHARTFTSDGRVLPIIPARGNHEGDGEMYNEIFGFPGGDQVDYWVTHIGANLSFITLDSNVSIGGDQAQWLEQKLQEAQSRRWIIPSYHRPAFPAVKTPSGARQFWVPLFEQYNVDVVCESDGHVLKRTVPIRNEKQDPTGIVYIGEGGLGVSQRTPISAWYLNSPGMAKSAHHVQIFSFTPEKLTYEARSMSGGVEDRYEFTPRRQGAVAPTEPEPTPAAPSLATVVARSQTSVAVTFSADMDPATAAVPGAYTFDPAVEITDVTAEDARTFVLTTTPMTEGTAYQLTVSGVRSAAGVDMAGPQVATFVGPTGDAPSDPWVNPNPTPEPQPAPGDDGAPALDGQSPSPKSGCTAAGGALAWGAVMATAFAVRRRRRN